VTFFNDSSARSVLPSSASSFELPALTAKRVSGEGLTAAG
jgi:hypothetical protein